MRWLLLLLRALCKPKAARLVENLCLRQPLAVLARQPKRPLLEHRDRRFWILMGRWFTGWRECLVIVRPETVLRWQV